MKEKQTRLLNPKPASLAQYQKALNKDKYCRGLSNYQYYFGVPYYSYSIMDSKTQF